MRTTDIETIIAKVVARRAAEGSGLPGLSVPRPAPEVVVHEVRVIQHDRQCQRCGKDHATRGETYCLKCRVVNSREASIADKERFERDLVWAKIERERRR